MAKLTYLQQLQISGSTILSLQSWDRSWEDTNKLRREDLVILAGLGKVYDNLWYRPKKRGLGYILLGCNTVQNSKPGIAKIGWLDLYPPPLFWQYQDFESALVDLTAMTLAKEDDYSLHFVLPSSRVMAEEYRDSEVEFWSKLGAKVTCDMA